MKEATGSSSVSLDTVQWTVQRAGDANAQLLANRPDKDRWLIRLGSSGQLLETLRRALVSALSTTQKDY